MVEKKKCIDDEQLEEVAGGVYRGGKEAGKEACKEAAKSQLGLII
ncbi:MAG: hypothetical protein ACI3YZ_08875 [Prevotella sp.]